MKNNFFIKNNAIFSICIAGIFLALIILLNFVFDLFKVWSWSIQMFLVIYAIGIYKIKNIIVNICFLLVTPPLLFAMENNVYAINGIQLFFEYFLVFYIFALLYISRCISNLFKKKNHYLIIDSFIFVVSFSLLIILKYFLHSIASYTWWSTPFWGSLVFNAPWLATNALTIPVAILICPFVFKLFKKSELENKNKW